MFRWIQQFFNASSQTKYFALNWAIYGILIILTTVYCYARLDYVRSYKTTPAKTQTGTK